AACYRIGLARCPNIGFGGVANFGGLHHANARHVQSDAGILDFPCHELRGIEQLQLLVPYRLVATEHILSLALCSVAVHRQTMDLLPQLTRAPLGLLHSAARRRECRSGDFLAGGALAQLLAERGEVRLELSARRGCFRQLGLDTLRSITALAPLFFRTLAVSSRVAATLFGDGNLAAKLLCALPLLGNEARELATAAFGGRACGVCGIACAFCCKHTLVLRRR